MYALGLLPCLQLLACSCSRQATGYLYTYPSASPMVCVVQQYHKNKMLCTVLHHCPKERSFSVSYAQKQKPLQRAFCVSCMSSPTLSLLPCPGDPRVLGVLRNDASTSVPSVAWALPKEMTPLLLKPHEPYHNFRITGLSHGALPPHPSPPPYLLLLYSRPCPLIYLVPSFFELLSPFFAPRSSSSTPRSLTGSTS